MLYEGLFCTELFASRSCEENEPSKTGQPLQSTADKESDSLETFQREGALPGNEKPNSQRYVGLETKNIAMATVMELGDDEKSVVMTLQ